MVRTYLSSLFSLLRISSLVVFERFRMKKLHRVVQTIKPICSQEHFWNPQQIDDCLPFILESTCPAFTNEPLHAEDIKEINLLALLCRWALVLAVFLRGEQKKLTFCGVLHDRSATFWRIFSSDHAGRQIIFSNHLHLGKCEELSGSQPGWERSRCGKYCNYNWMFSEMTHAFLLS